MTSTDIAALEEELRHAYAHRQPIAVPPSGRGGSFDLAAAYAVDAAHVRVRRAAGHRTVGYKVGYANKALWRVFKLDTVVWSEMYDDTVRYAEASGSALALGPLCSPRIEPEIVMRLRAPVGAGGLEPSDLLARVEWVALGFEVIDCPYAGWKFQPADFVAGFGFHAGLIVGELCAVTADLVPVLAEQLASFTVRLARNGEVVAEGTGRNSLRHPALCVAELASALAARGVESLAAGELISTGTLTDAQSVVPGETWTAAVEGIDLPGVTLRTS